LVFLNVESVIHKMFSFFTRCLGAVQRSNRNLFFVCALQFFCGIFQEYPWILSCSDDQTIRIWNWQSRSCIR